MIHYSFADDGVSIRAQRGRAPRLAERVINHCNYSAIFPAIETFNRGVKRGDTILVTGDRPRFALMRTYPEDKMDPDLIKLGDGRIHLRCQALDAWLDECDALEVVFHPGSTDYQVEFADLPQLKTSLLVSQAQDWGLIARLELANRGKEAVELELDFGYGGLRRCGRTEDAAYFPLDEADGVKNQASLGAVAGVITADNIQDAVSVTTFPPKQPQFTGGKLHFMQLLKLLPGETQAVYLAAERAPLGEDITANILSADPESLIRESGAYYQRILDQAVISTPSAILDAGLRTALWNLDSVYAGKAWLEGVHWWVAHWTNNYQISAAIALGQLERARRALEFYDSPEVGPCPVMTAAGKPAGGEGEDGLPYYIHTLCQYYHQSGDASLVERVWPRLVTSIERMFAARAGAGQGLLDWHLHCNAFLYQADHLGMPGEAASPSLMMAGMLERLAQVALRLGKEADASRWQAQAESMYAALRQRLWNEEAGAFYGHIDLQGIRHMAHYYTDLVFPALYTRLPEEYGHRSLDLLRSSLWVERDLPQPLGRLALMRVGDFKPPIFGNDNVMPVQMAEAARAFFKTGQHEHGFRLLEAVAWAGTLHTEAPGNFPEQMSEDGKGEANYLFGNPIGSFIYAVVDGLFGLSWSEAGETITWQPGFPQSWDHAKLALPYARLAYRAEGRSDQQVRCYQLDAPGVKKLDFRLDLPVGEVGQVLWNGQPLDFTLTPGAGQARLTINAPAVASHVIEVVFRPKRDLARPEAFPDTPSPSAPVYSMSDPAVAALLAQMQQEPARPLDLTNLYNTSTLHVTSAWRDSDLPVRLSPAQVSASAGFDLPQTGDNLVMVEYGRSHAYTCRTERSAFPNRVVIPVGLAVQALILLYASEVQSRHTGAQVGTLQLVYAHRAPDEIPLVCGKNLDTLFRHWAADTLPVPIDATGFSGQDTLNLYRLPCDPGDVLQELVIELDAPDVQVGLLAASVIERI